MTSHLRSDQVLGGREGREMERARKGAAKGSHVQVPRHRAASDKCVRRTGSDMEEGQPVDAR